MSKLSYLRHSRAAAVLMLPLFLAGCSELEWGGGAGVEAEVTFLPADLSGDGSEEGTGGTGGSETPVATGEPGSFTGRVYFTGTVPDKYTKPLYAQGADIKNKEVCSAHEDVPNEDLVLGTEIGRAHV